MSNLLPFSTAAGVYLVPDLFNDVQSLVTDWEMPLTGCVSQESEVLRKMFCNYNFISQSEKSVIVEREATVCGKGRLDFQAQGIRPLLGEDQPARSREYSLAA